MTGGGLLEPGSGNAPLAPVESLLTEGQAMLAAIAEDFAAIPGAEVATLRDARLFPFKPQGYEIWPVASLEEHLTTFSRLSAWADWTFVIAPEVDGVLGRWATQVLAAGGRLLSPSPEWIALATDKHAMAIHLGAAGIPVPRGHLKLPGDPLPREFSYPAVLKPVDGAGSQGIDWIQNAESEIFPSAKPRRLETYVSGLPASVAVLCGPAGCLPLEPCQQLLSGDKRFTYLGGALPLAPELARRGCRLGRRVAEALRGVVGYLGIDLVLGEDPSGTQDVVVEVNPRLTTSYVGLRVLARCNLAQLMLEVAEGGVLENLAHVRGEGASELLFRKDALKFDADGAVHPNCGGKL